MVFKRYQIYKYNSSGKFVAIERISDKKLVILDLNNELTNITKMRFQNHIKSNSRYKTDYLLEVEEETKINDDIFEYNVKYLRVIKSSDILLDKWSKTKTLEELPIGAYLHFTNEEKYWAGEEEGNLTKNIIASIILVIFMALSINYGWGMILFCLPALLIIDWNYKTWRKDKKADINKLKELLKYKHSLIQNKTDNSNKAKSSFQKQLENYDTWKSLNPEKFEYAVATWLNKQGYDLKVTQYSADGGIDLVGNDKNMNPTIVQVKKYTKNVGVAVIREMIGIRQNHPDNPNTIVVSLIGFTRGAKELANMENIVLMNIRDEIYES
uniref:restriction endonuclease n=1 Tax=Aliarcobacter sp. TaxID=2321116 RepID=UPI00404820AE